MSDNDSKGLKKMRIVPTFFKISVTGKKEPTYSCTNCGKMRYSKCGCIKKEGESNVS
jgi:hypothetical protein